MFDLARLRHDYHYKKFCVIEDLLPAHICEEILQKVTRLIAEKKAISLNFSGLGSDQVLDGGGVYQHKVIDGDVCRIYFPELVAFYHSMTPLVSVITDQDVVVSPYPKSDINIKIYGSNGDTQGWHYDTNAITALLYITTNAEGATACQVKANHPAKEKNAVLDYKIYPKQRTQLNSPRALYNVFI